MEALAEIEHPVPALAGGEARGQRLHIADQDGVVAEAGEGVAQGVDGDLAVEFGGVFLAVA